MVEDWDKGRGVTLSWHHSWTWGGYTQGGKEGTHQSQKTLNKGGDLQKNRWV